MKIFKMIMAAVMMLALSSCGTGASYSPEKCNELKEKIMSHQELTDDDYSDMLNQMASMVKSISEQSKAAENDEAKRKELKSNPEFEEMAGNCIMFALTLEAKKDKLSDSNKKKLTEIEKEIDQIKF